MGRTDRATPGETLTWATLDWRRLDRLRARFLAREPVDGPYWTSQADLANYDFTYAQRIGWKWDAVVRELRLRGWQPPRGPLLDWGCGSGIAGRRVLEGFSPEHFGALRVHDHSRLATDFAVERARTEFPGLPVTVGAEQTGGTLLVSHVVNELGPAAQELLRTAIDRADAVLWVEPGTYADSRALIGFRESLRGQWNVVAPCTHRAGCGMLHAPNAAHWCHHFATPPANLPADSDWVRFGQRAGVDLRSIPYSFLVLERPAASAAVQPTYPSTQGWSRVIGQPRLYKGFAKILDCSRENVREIQVQARDHAELFRNLKKGRAPTLLRHHTAPGGKDWQTVDETLG